MIKRSLSALILASATFTAPAPAQEPLPEICGAAVSHDEHAGHGDHGGHDAHAGHGAPDMADAPSPAHAAMLAGMDAMHEEMMQAMLAEDFDVAFICGMIPHHQGAIVMAEAALAHSEDPFVRQLAEEIVAAQEAEIVQMREWLAAR